MALYLNGTRVLIGVGGETGEPVNQVELTGILSTDGAYTGLTRIGQVAGQGLSAFQVSVLKSDGKWWLADADDETLSHRLIAMPLEAVPSGSSGRFLMQGYVRNDAWAWTPGVPLYLGSTPGSLTSTPPSAEDSTARVVAYAASATTIWFDQSGVSIKIGDPTVIGGVSIVGTGGDEEEPTPADYVVGVRIDEGSSTPMGAWIDRDGTVVASVSTLGWESFNDHPIIGGIRRCLLTPGTPNPTVTYGSNARGDGLTLTTDEARVMVEIPKFYVKESWNGDVRSMWISPDPLSGFEVHPAFLQRGGVEQDCIYVSSYDTTLVEIGSVEQLASRAGVSCEYSGVEVGGTYEYSKEWFVEKAEIIGDGWGLINAHTWSAIQLLWLVEHKTRYSQRARDFGGGIYWYGIADKAGVDFQSDAKNIDTRMDIYGTGIGDETSDPDANPMAWRGIVNLWGHLFTYLDGIEFQGDGRVWLRDAADINLVDTGLDIPSAVDPINNGYKGACIKNVARSTANCKYMFIPAGHATTGETPEPTDMSSYYCDAMVYHTTGETTIPIVKGSKTSGDACGLFRCDMDWLPDEAYPTANGRLEYIGPVSTS